MLVLTRKQNEKIRIGDNITITVVRMKGKSVRLGIEAPNNVNVLRGELVFDDAKQDADIHHSADIYAEIRDGAGDMLIGADQAASDTIIEYRVPRSSRVV
jgi:carbon storage regulator